MTEAVSAPVRAARRRGALTSAALFARAARVLATALVMVALALPGFLVRSAVRGRAAGRRHLYRRGTGMLMALGPTFVKAGQVLGTRRDVLPAGLCDELSVLQDSVVPLTRAQTRSGFAEAYAPDGTAATARVAVPLAEIDQRPIASGSVACVYTAVLPSGRRVAVKLRRPGIDRVMRQDLELIRAGARVAARLRPFRGMPVTEVVDSMCGAVLGQLDFAREADSLTRLRDTLSAVPRVWVPRVHPGESRPRCIVMEFIPDLDLDAAAACPPAMRRRFAESALTAVYHMLFVTGFVHCDLHPGNLYFTRAGQVVVLDAGFSVQLSERLRRLFAEFFMNMAVGRGRRCAEIVIESSAGLHPGADLEGFTVRMADLVERSHGLPAKDFSLIAFAAEMFDLQRRFGIHAASELIFPLLSLLVIEGTIRDLDPEIDFQEKAKPVLNRGLFGARA
ncbi:ABC1 kinase family protein [Spirillospora sp. NBC_01491]|uniref:ABC1 kinase family protein n=1 Tax=Spirillospora sp. NBC_01491 TaxID=2976007 RepID=UPI002E2FE1FA|nr:AarF/UbiB family protein [Spirillospora sp. NBC_01491]